MAEQAYEPRLKTEYRERIRAAVKEQFGYTNEMQIPKLDKIVLNMGIGEAVADSKKVNSAIKDLAAIAGHIDWSPFFQTWELSGPYPKILQDTLVGEAARNVFAEGQAMLGKIIAEKWLAANAVIGLFPASSAGDDEGAVRLFFAAKPCTAKHHHRIFNAACDLC